MQVCVSFSIYFQNMNVIFFVTAVTVLFGVHNFSSSKMNSSKNAVSRFQNFKCRRAVY